MLADYTSNLAGEVASLAREALCECRCRGGEY